MIGGAGVEDAQGIKDGEEGIDQDAYTEEDNNGGESGYPLSPPLLSSSV